MTDELQEHGRRLAHTMLRVRDLEASIAFYCDILGMQVLRRTGSIQSNLDYAVGVSHQADAAARLRAAVRRAPRSR